MAVWHVQWYQEIFQIIYRLNRSWTVVIEKKKWRHLTCRDKTLHLSCACTVCLCFTFARLLCIFLLDQIKLRALALSFILSEPKNHCNQGWNQWTPDHQTAKQNEKITIKTRLPSGSLILENLPGHIKRQLDEVVSFSEQYKVLIIHAKNMSPNEHVHIFC